MQKLLLLLSCLVCLAAAGRLGVERKPWWWQNVVGHEQEPAKWEISEEDIHQRQKLLLDVLLQVQNPVVNRDIIDLGKVLINDPAAYWESHDELLWEFLELCREHEVLGRTEIYNDAKIDHVRQLVGLTKFLTLAKDWPTFRRNVCFARLHMNPIMFVNALLMAVHEREDTRCLIMPAMHEILPQLFYDKDVILTAEKVEWLDLVSKTTTTKPSWLNTIGLGNMLSMISPIHWIRTGKTGLWRPWHERHWSPIEARRMEERRDVEVKEPIGEEMIVGPIGGPIIAPIGVTWRTRLDAPVAEDKIDDTKIIRQSEEKLVIPVEQQHSLSYLTDDVGLNIFWNHAMNQRLVETVTGDKHHKLHRLGEEKTMPWERRWKNHGRWERVEGRDEEWQPREWVRQETRNEGNWERAGGKDEDRRHTEWHPMTKAEIQQWWNEKLIAGERDEHEWTKAGWRQDDDIREEENVEDMLRRERMHGRNSEETENKRSLHANRRRENWQRPSWWHKRQNVPEMSKKTEKRWNSHVTEVEDEEDRERTRNHWRNIRDGRVVVEDVEHFAEWMAGEQKPHRGNWWKPESNKDWTLWQQRNHRLTEEITKPQGHHRGHSVETVEDNVSNHRADEILRRKHVYRHGDDDERLNKRNGWVTDTENLKWKSRDEPWRRDDVGGKNWWRQAQRKVNDDDWRMPRTNEDDEWMKTQRTERIPSMRRTRVDERDEVEDDDKDWQKTWHDRHITDANRLMYRTMKDDDWVNSQRRPIVGDREEVEINTMWEDRRPIVVDRKDNEVDRTREDRRRPIHDGRWVSRATNDDDWVTPKHERDEVETNTRWDDRRPIVVDRVDREVDRTREDRRRPIDDHRWTSRITNDDDWVTPKHEREEVEINTRWEDRRPIVVEREDREVDRTKEDRRRPIDDHRWMSRITNDDDWVTPKHEREEVEINTRWEDRRPIGVDREDVKVDRTREDRRRPIDDDRWRSRATNDDDWVTPKHEREEVEINTRWEDRRPIGVDREDVKVDRTREDRRRPIDDDRWTPRTANDDDWVTPKHEREIDDDDKEISHSRITRSIRTVDISPAQELMNARSGEMFIQNMQQLMARINMEKISLAQTTETKPVDEHIWRKLQLMTTSGKLYQQMMISPSEAHIKIEQSIWKLKHIIDNELEHVHMHPNNPDMVKMIGEILIQANGEWGNVWDELYNDINRAVYGLERSDNQATVLSVASTNLREPIYQDILTSLNELIWRYKQQLQPYRREQLLVPGIHVDHVEVDDLVTYFDVTDGDLINLVDQQLLQSNVNNVEKLEKQLVARQQRLNHKQFTLGYDITAEQPQRVVVRTFLGPKVDEHGRVMPLEVARQHYMLLDAFVENLIPGGNHIERNSRDIVWTTRDTSSLSEIYRRVMQAMPMHELVSSNCRYPHRLLLPRGTPSGLPMQLLIVVTPVREEDRVLQELVNPEWLCGLGIAAMHLDTLPLDFPMDRTIENVVDFLQPNMLIKDVLIKHDERVEVPRV